MPVKDRLGDVRDEIAEADDPSEIGGAHAFALGKRSKGDAVIVDEGGVKPARLNAMAYSPGLPSAGS